MLNHIVDEKRTRLSRVIQVPTTAELGPVSLEVGFLAPRETDELLKQYPVPPYKDGMTDDEQQKRRQALEALDTAYLDRCLFGWPTPIVPEQLLYLSHWALQHAEQVLALPPVEGTPENRDHLLPRLNNEVKNKIMEASVDAAAFAAEQIRLKKK